MRCGPIGQVVTTASGIVNGIGSLGAILQASVVVYITNAWDWTALFRVLAGTCVAASLVLVPYVLNDRKK